MNSFLFVFALVVSFIAVRIGAIGFQLTGVEWSLAKFQALSCFTGTGFTTKESELIASHPQRRRIASWLMVFGNAGLVTLIATFANSLRPSAIVTQVTLPFLDMVFPPSLLPLMNLLVLVVIVYVVYRIFTQTTIARKMTNALRARIIKRRMVKPVTFEELVVATGGYGVSSIEICDDSPVLGKTIIETDLRGRDITVLAIERGEKTIPNPSAADRIYKGDRLICFGKLQMMRDELCAAPE
ncbi:hypothetical protein AMJ39_03310 [candidate division TA06 bacterium DG_24]|jgi:hypothetical protein|uniref:RCK C-terminal domain-containing protein n=3 Tax=Bacteria division TA06 TaxID=1156500 RepID=A0A0S8J878_UNCT6|nr:MAG: hypothetical protein AMJ39_03310 [candidate division TA06 bacterium DG_24]KPK68004.1 MAG: hypothetical protein AMJ82_09335 [candidate division TA06 bacterium SM23_40]KPL05818.1 MAG: hypothetical protein AMJ71_10800 [candidate division TA06 bacterium SM1_40]